MTLAGHATDLARAAELFQPSEYTGLVLAHLRAHPALARGKTVCEIGTGNGVLAAQAAALGAAHVTVTDVDPLGLSAAADALRRHAPPGMGIACLQGPTWAPVGAQRFDLILANLPHFPAEHLTLPNRPASWGAGGADGRRILDPFIDGLARHLAPGGTALFTHNLFTDLPQTLDRLAALGLRAGTVAEIIVPLPPAKCTALAPERLAHDPGIFLLGAHYFGRVSLVLVTPCADEGAA